MAKGHAGGLSRKECESRGTLLEFLERYPDEESCERRLLEERHPGGFVCPACGNRTCSKVHGHAHKWQCTKCSRQFSVTAGTMMEGPASSSGSGSWPYGSCRARRQASAHARCSAR